MHTFAAEKTLDGRVQSALEKSPYFVRQRPDAETSGSRVILRGTVQSYYLKQIAQEVLRRVDGIEQIENHLEVACR